MEERIGLNVKLKTLRKESKMTQQELANKLGMSRSNYAQYETIGTKPPVSTLKKLSDIFGVSTDYLLGKQSDKTKGVDSVDLDISFSTIIELCLNGEYDGVLFKGKTITLEMRHVIVHSLNNLQGILNMLKE